MGLGQQKQFKVLSVTFQHYFLWSTVYTVLWVIHTICVTKVMFVLDNRKLYNVQWYVCRHCWKIQFFQNCVHMIYSMCFAVHCTVCVLSKTNITSVAYIV